MLTRINSPAGGQKKKMLIFAIGFAVVFIMLFGGISAANAQTPAIAEYWNSQTKDNNTNFGMELKSLVVFRATVDQSIDTWRWYVDDIEQNVDTYSAKESTDNSSFTWRAGPEDKAYTIKVNGTNVNGTTNTITWNISIPALGFGSISGTVMDKDTGITIDGITITNGAYSATTDVNGAYTISNLQEGGYIFTVSKDGYNSMTKYIEVIADQTTTQDFQLAAFIPAAISYDGTKINIQNGTATLTAINQALNDPNLLEQLSPKEWLLKVPIQVTSTGIFYINDSDTDWLKLLSLNDGNEAYIANSGFLEIKNTRITSWNTTNNDFAYMTMPDKDNDTTRAYIYAQGTDAAMNIYNSDVSYLGQDDNIYKQGVEYFKTGNLFEIINSTFTNNHRGIYILYTAGGLIKDNTIMNSVDRGIDTHQENDNPLIIDGNTVDNPIRPSLKEGIVIQGNNSIIKNNYVSRVGYNGIHVIIQSYYNIVESNAVYYAYHSGIDIHNYASNNIIRNNVTWDAGHDEVQGGTGIFVHNYGVHDNEVTNNVSYNNRNSGFNILGGYNNTLTDSTAYGSPLGIKIYAAEGNLVENSDFRGNGNDIRFYNSYWTDVAPYPNDNNIFTNVSFSTVYMWNTDGANQLIDPKGDSFKITLATIKPEDDNNNLLFKFTDGRTFKLNGDAGGHTSVTLTEIGTYTIEVETGSDIIPPFITAHSPEGTSVAVDTAISITFSEAMDTLTTEAAFSLSPSVSGAFSWSGNEMVFTPNSNLSYETTYTVTIATGAEDVAGNNLQSQYSYQFTTVSESASFSKGDINQDGKVNLTDFISLLSKWLQTASSPFDLNDDNKVNTRDLGIMMSNWKE